MRVRAEQTCFHWVVVAAAALAAVAATACGGNGAGNGSAQGGAGGRRGGGPAIDVTVTPVQRMNIQRTVDLAGTLNSPDQAKVSSEVAGVVRQVMVEIGSEVSAGQPLVRIDPRELDLALARAESALRQTYAQLGMHEAGLNVAPPPDDQVASVKTAMATLVDAQAGMARAKALSARGILSPVDLQTADTKLKVAEAGYQAALDNVRSLKAQLQDRRAAFELAQKKVADTVVKAPITGAIVDRYVQPGEFIAERTAVVTVVQINPLKLRSGIQERFAGVVKAGQPVEFRVAVDRPPGTAINAVARIGRLPSRQLLERRRRGRGRTHVARADRAAGQRQRRHQGETPLHAALPH
jgi:multidrug resistance efflux pump